MFLADLKSIYVQGLLLLLFLFKFYLIHIELEPPPTSTMQALDQLQIKTTKRNLTFNTIEELHISL